jgi:hypothetical protein
MWPKGSGGPEKEGLFSSENALLVDSLRPLSVCYYHNIKVYKNNKDKRDIEIILTFIFIRGSFHFHHHLLQPN